jgi:DNA-directed RNA polymerase subunit alpha
MVEFDILTSPETMPAENEPEPVPRIEVEEETDRYGKFVIAPLLQGYGMTLGNPLRRVLYSSLTGSAVTWVKIDGVLHEYTTIPNVKEQVSDILINIKGVRLRSSVDRPGKLRLEVAGQGEVSAGDIMASSDFEVVNPEWHIATLDSDDAALSIELNVERGSGYAEATKGDGLPIGVLPVDAVYTPILKVNYSIENTRVGQRTDLERLIVELWTDGSISPVDAMRQAGSVLVESFFLFANTHRGGEDDEAGTPAALLLTPEQYNTEVEKLDLSSRTLNCLKRASIDKVGQVLELKRSDLLEIRNFGEKSLTELYSKLRELELMPPELDPDLEEDSSDGATGTENANETEG